MEGNSEIIEEAREYWDEKDDYKSHGESIYPGYHEYRLGKVKALIDSIPEGDLTCVDVGCGEGDLIVHGNDKGWDVSGFDLSESMVEKARNKLEENDIDPSKVYQGGMEELEEFEDDSVDILLVINVLPYLDEQQDSYFYEQASRIVPPDGKLIIAHSNELFDLFTFNKYTVQFFENAVLPLSMDDSDEIQEAKNEIRDLITHPDEPKKEDQFASERDELDKRRENPLSFPDKLDSVGFSQENMLFTHYHAVPPLLISDEEKYTEFGKKLENEGDENGFGHFMASIFISKSIKQ